MARTRKDLNGELIFNSLTSWKSLYQIDGDPYVEGLLSALVENKDLEIWASLNPLEYLPHSPAIENQPFNRAIFILAIIRNSLVFSPVALTWLAISKATAAFSAYTAENSLTVVNFLEFWENGYGVLGKTWSLSRVATLDFQIILLIIALTVFLGISERRTRKMRSAAMDEADRDRIQISLELSKYLYDKQRPTVAVVNATTASMLQNLKSASKAMEQSSKELNKSVRALPSHRDLLTEIKKIKSRLFVGEK